MVMLRLPLFLVTIAVSVLSTELPLASDKLLDIDTVVPESHNKDLHLVSTKAVEQADVPDWFTAEVESIRVEGSSEAFATQGLWDAIQGWDTAHPSNSFFGADETANKIMLAGFLGNVAQETGGLKYTTELAPPDFTSPCTIASGNCQADYGIYFGRGALQVTCWGGEYCSAYKDVADTYGITDMESNPDQVSTDPTLAWGSAVVFWMTNTGAGSQGPAAKWLAQNSFGGTYATINGALECPPTNTQGVEDSRVANRITHFLQACTTAGVDCSNFEMTCPSSEASGTCGAPHDDWKCSWNGDCGAGGVCNIEANAGVCAKQDWKCFSDTDCGQSGPCNLPSNKGTCQNEASKNCWRDSDCSAGACSLPNLSTCHGNSAWGCRKDNDCGQSGPCSLSPPGGGKCRKQPTWACWVDSDCGSDDTCELPNAGVCNGNDWGCRKDSDCGDSGPCWVNPGPTGVPGVCSAQKAWKCYTDVDCGSQGQCVAP